MSETTQDSPGVTSSPPGPSTRASGTEQNLFLTLLKQRETAIFVIAALTFLLFWLLNSTFVSSTTLAVNFNNTFPPIIIIALGEVFLLINGEIDLSVGFLVAFAPFMAYFLDNDYHVPALLAVIIGLLLGLVVGLLNGFLTVTLGLPSFITTLGTGFVVWGITLYTSHAEPATIPPDMANFGSWLGGGNKYSWLIWAVVLTLLFHVLLTKTRWGTHTVAVGGNLLGAQEAGISVAKIKYGNFMMTGLLGALVGFQTMYYTSTIDPNAGSYTPMFSAVTAAVIGGTAMLGGSGTILGACFGAIVLANLQTGFSVEGISASVIYIIQGAAILIAMIANVWLTRARERGVR